MKRFLLACLVLVSLSSLVAAKQLLNLDREGIAIQGYDPVAFFTDNRPVKGNPQYQSDFNGAKYYFVSSEHKAAFDKEPAKYEPQFGGYCAYGVSHGAKAPSRSKHGRSSTDVCSCSMTSASRTHSTKTSRAP